MAHSWEGGVVEGVVALDGSPLFLEGGSGMDEVNKVLAAYLCHASSWFILSPNSSIFY